jgi:hypothetical protein
VSSTLAAARARLEADLRGDVPAGTSENEGRGEISASRALLRFTMRNRSQRVVAVFNAGCPHVTAGDATRGYSSELAAAINQVVGQDCVVEARYDQGPFC